MAGEIEEGYGDRFIYRHFLDEMRDYNALGSSRPLVFWYDH
ncbi:hypothetical protein QY97_03314 [Bacillus thermotolerans]|uniref:Uncharacterized protein n=1 Tax=Bacillus thermotolerans TaxID=1221996 RepID=A0A0F5HJJ1_BACTR|nr:hypothetical protein QY97_03314 [Bacillus thermotolerans]KKB33848.1 hypothetical protein QY96_00382 [Bacillus thermotolerans]KKB42859.1 hypothetical protein QY95_03332 [Bacillus thermotolerans]